MHEEIDAWRYSSNGQSIYSRNDNSKFGNIDLTCRNKSIMHGRKKTIGIPMDEKLCSACRLSF